MTLATILPSGFRKVPGICTVLTENDMAVQGESVLSANTDVWLTVPDGGMLCVCLGKLHTGIFTDQRDIFRSQGHVIVIDSLEG